MHVLRTGVPAAQQSLKFAGRDLPDESYIGEELHLDEYNTRQEVGGGRRATD